MLPFPLPKPGQAKVSVFGAGNFSGLNNVGVWMKPVCSVVSATVIGPGGGGGAGFSGAAGTARGGGGGGGSGAIHRVVWPSWAVPDVLFAYVALGATQEATSNPSSLSVVSQSGGTAANLWAFANAGSGGSNGTGSTGGSGGSQGSATVASSAIGSQWGIWTSTAGQAGASGGAHTGAVGGSVSLAYTQPLSGGAGGGGVGTSNTDNAGGNLTGTGIFPTLSGGVASSGPGADGYIYQLNQSLLAIRELAPYAAAFGLMQYGGSGGGTAGASGTAGAGGRGGGYGTGGGGGGGGVAGGAGGKGGDGLIVIVCW